MKFYLLIIIVLNSFEINSQMKGIFKDSSSASVKWYAEDVNNKRFYIGTKVKYEGNIGLKNINNSENKTDTFNIKYIEKYLNKDSSYNEKNYIKPVWLHILRIIAAGEGEHFNTINTYDDADFTFGPFQFAAHPRANRTEFPYFLSFFKHVIKDSSNLFPDLRVLNDSIIQITETNDTIKLQSGRCNDKNYCKLRKYLNPKRNQIDSAEVLNTAKFSYFIENEDEKEYIVKFFADTLIQRLIFIDSQLIKNGFKSGLDSVPDYICAIIIDNMHHGRADYEEIADILNDNIEKFDVDYENEEVIESLIYDLIWKPMRCRILGITFSDKYSERKKTLEYEINFSRNQKYLGNGKWSREELDIK